jgi:formylglycine-generating enzyme required for sulfatase activity
MTMVLFPAGSFFRKEDAGQVMANDQKVVLTRSFLLSDREVTAGMFQRFMDDPDYPAEEKPQNWMLVAEYSPTPEHPVNGVNWFDAALFCNWLSRRENLQPCYERTGQKQRFDTNFDGKVDDQDREFEDWRRAEHATGYRLPTGAEWEYACRAGTTTAFAFGDDEALLKQYAVYAHNASRTEVAGVKLPNAWGLFDMHGNLSEWCYDGYGPYNNVGQVVDPTGPEDAVTNSSGVLRGGAFLDLPVALRSSHRDLTLPGFRDALYGFRPARTYP